MIPFIRNVHKSKIYRQKWLPQAGVGVGITANRHKASLEEGRVMKMFQNLIGLMIAQLCI